VVKRFLIFSKRNSKSLPNSPLICISCIFIRLGADNPTSGGAGGGEVVTKCEGVTDLPRTTMQTVEVKRELGECRA
jgi:hypothetical protein